MHNAWNYEPPRYFTSRVYGILDSLLGIRHEIWMQDYPLEVADPTRIDEFCTVYESGEIDEETKFALMQLILFSLDERVSRRVAGETDASDLVLRVEQLLQQDFLLHFHTIDYWRCAENGNDPYPLPESERIFSITPMMRQVWKQCYRSEFSSWLSKGKRHK